MPSLGTLTPMLESGASLASIIQVILVIFSLRLVVTQEAVRQLASALLGRLRQR